MKISTKRITIGSSILVSGFGLFGIISFMMNHGFLMDYGYLIHYQQETTAFFYPQSTVSQFTNEITQWGIIGYLRIGFLIMGLSGMTYLIINGVILLTKRKI